MRSYSRFGTDLEIGCITEDGQREMVRLYNLSCGGCMIEVDGLDVQKGNRVKIRVQPNTDVPGRIAWRIDNNAGIAFDIPVHTKLVESMGYMVSEEDFDRYDPRDRFGIPLIG